MVVFGFSAPAERPVLLGVATPALAPVAAIGPLLVARSLIASASKRCLSLCR